MLISSERNRRIRLGGGSVHARDAPRLVGEAVADVGVAVGPSDGDDVGLVGGDDGKEAGRIDKIIRFSV